MARTADTGGKTRNGASSGNGGARKAEQHPIDPLAEAIRQWEAHDFGAIEHMAATTSLTRIHQILVRRIDRELQGFRLTFAQYEALLLLHFSRSGSLPLGKMGRRLMVHPATITGTIDLLEEKGFVRRERAEADRRQVLATITPKGRSVVKKATKALVDIRYGLEQMTVEEARVIATVVADVRERAGDYV